MGSKSLLKVSAVLGLFLASGTVASWVVAAEDEAKPKHTIKEAMKLHKEKLHEKVIAGEATDEEKQMLLDVYISMAESTPKKGDMESWHELTDALVIAGAKAVVGREDAAAALKAATNCMACHKIHK